MLRALSTFQCQWRHPSGFRSERIPEELFDILLEHPYQRLTGDGYVVERFGRPRTPLWSRWAALLWRPILGEDFGFACSHGDAPRGIWTGTIVDGLYSSTETLMSTREKIDHSRRIAVVRLRPSCLLE